MAEKDIVDKSGLCIALGWSKPRLDRNLERDPNFPVRKKGTQAGGWEFHLPTIIEYMAHQAAAKRAGLIPDSKDEDDDESEPPLKPAGAGAPLEHQGEATAKQRRDHAQALLLEDKIRRERGELVEAEAMRLALTDAVGRLSKSLDALPDAIVKRLSLPQAKADEIRDVIDGIRETMASELARIMDP